MCRDCFETEIASFKSETEWLNFDFLLSQKLISGHVLNNLPDLTILIDVPITERHNRLSGRESDMFLNEWENTLRGRLLFQRSEA